ncbi:undecaprenyldiphospho-muramoylpentapeptide beta-N-acetylglucosaminyltransferase [Rickettsiella endosymbiont of Miltochrista miniata]|uniref:undecaprenyldiphospho-muramoylpentapeptide beta-N-acetylglucosaminyltransferase n=1 Tax=Rickettsiella endosymbiont of Miltochrista miniata TaxID=3066239 RepID=UPI00313B5BF5
MKKKIKIIFTGGGSSGHVTPSLPLISALQNKGIDIFYIGSKKGIEHTLIKPLKIPYYAITTGKLHRYWTWKNLLTPFQLLIGTMQSLLICRKIKPDVIFSKGGFVALPVVIAAKLNGIPVVIHESDLTPGLANRLSFPFAKLICITFPETVKYFKNTSKVLLTGMPIRDSLLHGNPEKGLKFCGFADKQKPVLLIMGGGLGSTVVNECIRRLINPLTAKFQVIHICGKNKSDPAFAEIKDYKQFEYLQGEFADVLASADLVISRAGATSIYELLALNKPNILLPLSKKASRGDQIDNAKYFAHQGLSKVIYFEEFSDEKLLKTLFESYENLDQLKCQLSQFNPLDATQIIIDKLLYFSYNR